MKTVLGYANGRKAVADHVDTDERSTVAISDGTSPKGGNPNYTFISESGVYALVVRSNKPEAKRWWKRVRSEVLPSIRKTGAYVAPGANIVSIIPPNLTPESATTKLPQAVLWPATLPQALWQLPWPQRPLWPSGLPQCRCSYMGCCLPRLSK